jgi:hypothetical protein
VGSQRSGRSEVVVDESAEKINGLDRWRRIGRRA